MRILLAVDGSRPAERASQLVAALPWREGGHVRIVNVAPDRADLLGVSWMAPIPLDADQIEKDVLRSHREALEAAELEIRSARDDLVIETALLRGRVASCIVREAHNMAADLVVLGHRGHGPWESMLLGSVSAEVVDHAPCPVLVARDERLGPVIFGDDGSPSARAAEAAMIRWPMFTGVPVTVVSVVEQGYPYASALAPVLYLDTMAGYADAMTDHRRVARETCEATAHRLRDAGFEATAEVRDGDAAHELVTCAREHGAGLIVIGTRGMSGLRRLVLGSVARNVLLHAECSVLIVREAADKAAGADRRRELGATARSEPLNAPR